ncbi:MAG TPA: T9SS type A sorting domain-containing protein, partial [Candidatus Marinimicrobia bacterium]|nr:T9SS type A sorting domain-containing protein [Candidatus Neomarinimicrobiota bacterium]
MLGAGSDWGQPYNCSQWANKFDLTYPLLDDSGSNLFFDFAWDGSSQAGNQYYIPMNIIIDHNMVVRYRAYGFNENGVKNEIEDLIGEMKSASIVGEETKHIQPSFITLHSAYPNPFNPWTNISFTLTEATVTDIVIYNSLGKEVDKLAGRTLFDIGTHTIRWDAEDVPSGVYLIRLET